MHKLITLDFKDIKNTKDKSKFAELIELSKAKIENESISEAAIAPCYTIIMSQNYTSLTVPPIFIANEPELNLDVPDFRKTEDHEFSCTLFGNVDTLIIKAGFVAYITKDSTSTFERLVLERDAKLHFFHQGQQYIIFCDIGTLELPYSDITELCKTHNYISTEYHYPIQLNLERSTRDEPYDMEVVGLVEE